MKRGEILSKASALITGERHEQHGDAESTYAVVGALWGAYLSTREYGKGEALHPYDVLHMMALMKVGRASLNPGHGDNYVDTAGYIGLAGELALNGSQDERYESDFKGVDTPAKASTTKRRKRARRKA